MSKLLKTIGGAIGVFALLLPPVAGALEIGSGHSITKLTGHSEVHGPNLGVGAIFSTGSGELELKIDTRSREIRYRLTYDFPDAGNTTTVGAQFVNQAHFHFGQEHTTGGITVWLCKGDNVPSDAAVAAATPMCPSPSGTVEGSILAGQVLALAGQGLPGGEDGFDALLRALQAGAIYANVHTDRFPPGEIRGQVRLNQGRNN